MFDPSSSRGKGTPSLITRVMSMKVGEKFLPYRVWGALGQAIAASQQERATILDLISKGEFPGKLILELAGNNATFADLFEAFCTYGSKNWTWCDPGVDAGSNWVKLLGGESIAGECGVMAEALMKLAVLPPPLGLGLNIQIAVQTYAGQHQQGFIVDERDLVPFGPHAVRCNMNCVINVCKPVQTKTTMTLWGNHKVIAHAGALWDPCYGIVYALPTDIIAYQIQKTNPALPYYTGVAVNGTRALFLPAESANGRSRYLGPLDEADAQQINQVGYYDKRKELILIENYL